MNIEEMRVKADKALASLGATSFHVAASLQAKGITGYKNSCGECPIANFLRGEFPGYAVEIYCETYSVFLDRVVIAYGGKPIFRGTLPRACVYFIDDFDNEAQYQNLRH